MNNLDDELEKLKERLDYTLKSHACTQVHFDKSRADYPKGLRYWMLLNGGEKMLDEIIGLIKDYRQQLLDEVEREVDKAIHDFYTKVFNHAYKLGQEFPEEKDPNWITDPCNADDKEEFKQALNKLRNSKERGDGGLK